MSLSSIWKLTDPIQAVLLRREAEAVNLASIAQPEFQQLIDDMEVIMYRADGIGLAAPQIGLSIRLAVIAKEADHRKEKLVIINPVITHASSKQSSMEEGCLSLPGVYGPVRRASSLTLQALDRHGRAFTIQARGMLARVIQHEVDHLHGKLFIDRADTISKGQELLP